MPDPGAFHRAADALAREPGLDEIARALRQVAEGRGVLARDGFRMAPADNPNARRRRLLRLVWRSAYPGTARTAAARLIAAAWQAHASSPREAIPCTEADIYSRLGRSGCRPLAWRQIADDLDEMLYPD